MGPIALNEKQKFWVQMIGSWLCAAFGTVAFMIVIWKDLANIYSRP